MKSVRFCETNSSCIRFFRLGFALLLGSILSGCGNYDLSLEDFFGGVFLAGQNDGGPLGPAGSPGIDIDAEDFGPVPPGSITRFEVADRDQWIAALGAIGSGGNYVITLTDDLSIIPGASTFGPVTGITVSLRGAKTLSVDSFSTGNLLNLMTNQTLILRDADLQGRDPNSSAVVQVNSGGRFFMRSGKIIDNKAGNGGGVFVSGGVFTMSGGTIQNNTATTFGGGGVYVNSGAFIMNGGTISGNHATNSTCDGGGVYVNSGGSFTLTGSGTISGNTASTNGGGVVVDSGSFTMSGGTIFNNTATTMDGGGVHVTNGAFTMSSGTISGNHATGSGSSSGGGVFFSATSASFFMSGGTISDNDSNDKGGGVFFSSAIGTFNMSGGTISGNTASTGGGVYVNGSFSKSGGGIIYGDTSNIHTPGSTENTATGGPTRGNAVFYNSGGYYRDITLFAGDDISTSDLIQPPWGP